MSDPLPTDSARAFDAASETDREAKIEQLLLVGLDRYFAAQYEQAIDVWTRALFLDRNHPRAHAYIERARSAVAQRQRESEELLQNGVATFHRGDGDEARRLLQSAIDVGAPPDDALALRDRLSRVGVGTGHRAPARSPRAYAPADTRQSETAISRSDFRFIASVTLVLVMAAVGVYVAAVWDRGTWPPFLALPDQPVTSGAASAERKNNLPLPRRGATALAGADAFAANGRLHDALSALDGVRPTDAQKVDTDRLRADIQRQLLGLAAGTAPPPAGLERGEGRLP